MNRKTLLLVSFVAIATFIPLKISFAQNIYTVGDGGQFGFFDLQTKNYTSINLNLGTIYSGLTYQDNTFYTIAAFTAGRPLRTITSAGVLTNIGDTNFNTSGIASDGTTIYDHNFNGNHLGTLSTATGAFTDIGATGFTASDIGGRIAFNGSALYGTMRASGGSGSGLYLFNTGTGAATFIGNGGAASSYDDMSSTFSSNGTLYGIQNVSGTQTLYTIDIATGNLTTQGAITGSGMPTSFYGAAQAVVPEPNTYLILTLGAGALLVKRRKSAC